MADEVYIGDGLYVHFNGYEFVLRAPRMEGDHWVALEPSVLTAFQNYVARTQTPLPSPDDVPMS
jgi:hypothetical protein